MNKHRVAVVDIETLHNDITQRVQVIEIGAARFTMDNTIEMINIPVSGENGAIGLDTVKWWAKQQGFSSILEPGVIRPIQKALNELETFLGGALNEFWSRGTFDFPILDKHFAHFEMKPPWEFWQCRDLRTVHMFAESLGFPKISRHKAHRAGIDARQDLQLLEEIDTWFRQHLQINVPC